MYDMKLVKASKLVFGMQESLSSFQTSRPNTHAATLFYTLVKKSGWGTETGWGTDTWLWTLDSDKLLLSGGGAEPRHHRGSYHTGFVQCWCWLYSSSKVKLSCNMCVITLQILRSLSLSSAVNWVELLSTDWTLLSPWRLQSLQMASCVLPEDKRIKQGRDVCDITGHVTVYLFWQD